MADPSATFQDYYSGIIVTETGVAFIPNATVRPQIDYQTGYHAGSSSPTVTTPPGTPVATSVGPTIMPQYDRFLQPQPRPSGAGINLDVYGIDASSYNYGNPATNPFIFSQSAASRKSRFVRQLKAYLPMSVFVLADLWWESNGYDTIYAGGQWKNYMVTQYDRLFREFGYGYGGLDDIGAPLGGDLAWSTDNSIVYANGTEFYARTYNNGSWFASDVPVSSFGFIFVATAIEMAKVWQVSLRKWDGTQVSLWDRDVEAPPTDNGDGTYTITIAREPSYTSVDDIRRIDIQFDSQCLGIELLSIMATYDTAKTFSFTETLLVDTSVGEAINYSFLVGSGDLTQFGNKFGWGSVYEIGPNDNPALSGKVYQGGTGTAYLASKGEIITNLTDNPFVTSFEYGSHYSLKRKKENEYYWDVNDRWPIIDYTGILRYDAGEDNTYIDLCTCARCGGNGAATDFSNFAESETIHFILRDNFCNVYDFNLTLLKTQLFPRVWTDLTDPSYWQQAATHPETNGWDGVSKWLCDASYTYHFVIFPPNVNTNAFWYNKVACGIRITWNFATPPTYNGVGFTAYCTSYDYGRNPVLDVRPTSGVAYLFHDFENLPFDGISFQSGGDWEGKDMEITKIEVLLATNTLRQME